MADGRQAGTESAERRKPHGQPPLTPMIDVAFQLLLFFLLTCEFRPSEGHIPGSLPAGSVPPSGCEMIEPIPIRIRPTTSPLAATYEMTGVPVTLQSPAELFARLRARQDVLGARDLPVVVAPARNVPWQLVVEAFSQATRAGVRRIGFAEPRL